MNSTKTYEVNANGNCIYTSDSAAKVADIAVTWATQGHEPHAYAKADTADGLVRVVRVPVTGKRATKAALLAA